MHAVKWQVGVLVYNEPEACSLGSLSISPTGTKIQVVKRSKLMHRRIERCTSEHRTAGHHVPLSGLPGYFVSLNLSLPISPGERSDTNTHLIASAGQCTVFRLCKARVAANSAVRPIIGEYQDSSHIDDREVLHAVLSENPTQSLRLSCVVLSSIDLRGNGV